MANMTLPHVWGVQRPQIMRPCLGAHAEAEAGCRRSAAGPALTRPALRSTAYRASRQQSTQLSAVADAPAAQSTSRMLVDLCIASLPLNFGAHVRIVGDCGELGSWDVDAAPQFQWADGDEWNKQLELPAGEHEFKGPNRKAKVPAPEQAQQSRLELRCEFGNTQSMAAKVHRSPAPTAQSKEAPAKPAQPKGKSPVPRQNSRQDRPAAPAQAAATEAPPTSDPSLKDIKKTEEDDGSITFSFPKGYRFKGGIEDSVVEDDADAGEQQVTDEYEQGELVQITEDPETTKAREQAIADYNPQYSDSELKGMDEAYGKAMGGQEAGAFDMDKLVENTDQGGWTMGDEYDAPIEEYGDDRPDADKDEGGETTDWTQDNAGAPFDYNDPGPDTDFSME